VIDEGKKTAAIGVIAPANSSFLERIWKGLEIEAGRLLRAVAVPVDDRDRAK
jgi:hypothetical protein